MPRSVVIDFETASCADLTKVGAWRYAEDPSTFILCLGYKLLDGDNHAPTRVLTEQDICKRDPELMDLVLDSSVIFIAHNAGFEQAIWRHVMAWQHGWPEMPPHRWHDTMAVACRRTLPPALDNLGAVLQLPIQKDKEGHRLMMQMCKPAKDGNFDHSPVKFTRLIQYNVGDVDTQYHVHMKLGGLGAKERKVWLLDQKMNQRGIRVDVPYVRQCMGLLEAAKGPLDEEFERLTGGIKVTQRAKVLEWIQNQGVKMFDLRKATLDAFLDPENPLDDFDDLPPNVLRVIQIRRILASSSVSKLGRMIETMNYDGRIRGTMQYHGARTGRNAGRLVQPLNMPRPTILSDNLPQGAVMAMIRAGDLDAINGACGNAYDAVISTLRGCFTPAPGKKFVAGDFNAIEARVVLALAGEYDRADSFDKGDAYCDMAATIYGRKVTKADKEERQMGKTVVLGCLAEGTQVLTHSGWKAIETVTVSDRLWDGEQWVEHQGLLDKGLKPTLPLCGLWLTPDHLVWCGTEGWLPAEQAVARGSGTIHRALASGSANWLSLDMWLGLGEAFKHSSSSAVVEALNTPWRSAAFAGGDPAGATYARSKPLLRLSRKNTIGLTRMRALMTSIVRDFSTVFRQLLPDAIIPAGKPNVGAGSLPDMLTGASLWLMNGAQIGQLSSDTLSHYLGGTTRRSKWTGSTIIEATNPATSGLSTEAPTSSIGEQCTASRKKLRTYDIACAGPRNRFTVATDAGPIIVHNCGFQMSAAKFALVTGLSEEFSQKAVTAYRKEWAPLVPKLWYGLEKASTDAVWCNDRRAYQYRGISYQMKGSFLVCTLPSGREIYYFEPKREQKVAPWDSSEILPAWSFLSFAGKRIQRKFMFGGLATENVVQAVARDIMVEAMFRCEERGLELVFTVYDEIIAEVPEDLHRADKILQECMEERSEWVQRFRIPIRAECEEMTEYRK